MESQMKSFAYGKWTLAALTMLAAVLGAPAKW
jgi:hypothetical protein